MKKGDIVLIPFPFTDLKGNKLRPAIVLISTKADVTICFITSLIHWFTKYDIKLLPSEQNGLKKASVLKTSKICTFGKDLILGKIGRLEEKYIIVLNKKLIEILQLD